MVRCEKTVGGVTYRVALRPDLRTATVRCAITVEHPSTTPGERDIYSHEFGLTRDQLTPLVMKFLMGG